MAENVWDIGDAIVLHGEFRNRAGALTDATVVCKVRHPDGTVETVTVTKTTTGTYEATFLPSVAGAHQYRMAATGGVTTAAEDTFRVRDQWVT